MGNAVQVGPTSGGITPACGDGNLITQQLFREANDIIPAQIGPIL